MIVYSVDIKNARLQEVIDAIDAQVPNGFIVIGTIGLGTILATVTLARPSFGAPAAGIMDLASVPRVDTDTDATGTAAEAAILDGAGNIKASGLTVGIAGSGKDIIISTINIVQHQRLEISSGRIRHG